MKKIIVTTSWDDGHKLDIKVASLLKKYGVKGTFYITPKNRDFFKKDLLTDRQIVAIGKDFEIGAHTLTHPLLPRDLSTVWYKLTMKIFRALRGKEYKMPANIGISEAKEEIIGSKRYLETLLRKEIISFCYPGGRHNNKIQKLVKEVGFKYARTIDEYCFSIPENFLVSGTSIHAFRHYRDIFKNAKFSKWNLGEFIRNSDWQHLAKRMFDHVLEEGGIYHFWGHSWLIEESSEWDKLENVLSYIANRKNVKYLTNSELVVASGEFDR